MSSASSSIKLPGPLVADKLMSPDAITVPVNVGAADKTLFPVPVEVVTPVPPLATGSVPVTPLVSGRPVAFVRTPDAGVPSAGPVNVGDVRVRPAIVVTVAPDAIDVEPMVGAENPDTVPQEVEVPSVVKNLPELPD